MHLKFNFGMAGLVLIISLPLSSCSFDFKKHAKAQRCSKLFAYQRKTKTTPELEQEFYNVNKRFAGEGIFFLDFYRTVGEKHCGEPSNSYVQFVKGISENKPQTEFLSLVRQVDTAIHETAHGFSSDAKKYEHYIAGVNKKGAQSGHGLTTSIYLKKTGIRHLRHTASFPARKITNYIKDQSLLKQARYKVYIQPSLHNHVTQRHGIYGLLDEYHAYYYSVLTDNNILRQLNSEQRRIYTGPDRAFITVGQNDNSLSYLQFTTYILSYFRVAEKEYPAIYQQMLANRELLDVFIALHDNFEKIYRESQRLVKKDKKAKDYFSGQRKALVEELKQPDNQRMLRKIRRENRKAV
ncbi:MAG: hypothetical protein OEZ33_04860 [Gammaproteobacteria bacterium]|nr:hypothetical protein [Gammaproteobacteria bacterium]MDH5777519.1 hypothetical protein [Gammaproteobacteria bacterium]